MPCLPEAIIPVLASFAPLFSQRVWLHVQLLLLGAMLAPGARTVTAALRTIGLSGERHFTDYHRVLNRATWSARQASRILLELLVTSLVPPGTAIVLGADDTMERRRGRPPVAVRCVLLCDPEGTLRLEAFFCTDLQATPEQILAWVVMRWSVKVTFEEARAHLGAEIPRQWSDGAIARTSPVLLALFALVTLLALRLRPEGPIPVQATAWYPKAEPTLADCLALVRRHLWCARYLVHSAAEAKCVQFPREAVDLLIHGFPLAT